MTRPTVRTATVEDALFVLEMSLAAAHGLLPVFFSEILAEGDNLQDVMLSAVEDPQSKISYAKCWIAELDGRPAGMINLDPIPDPPDPIDRELPAIFHPLAELEASVPGALIIEFLATVPEARGRGVGTALLDFAKSQAGPAGVALVVSDNNISARALYERAGFKEAGRTPIVKERWETTGMEWILMTRP